MNAYSNYLKSFLTPAERKVFSKLTTPQKIQDYLDTLPINFELHGETNMSPRRVLGKKTAHCLEGAVFAAAALAYHGHKPLLMDFRTTMMDEDHVVALFRQNEFWGAISKTNHAILRYRDPVYRSLRELAMSYFHEYLLWSGAKSLREYSTPFDLSRFPPERWVIAESHLNWLPRALDRVRHFPIVPRKIVPRLRAASRIETKAMRVVEWKVPKGFKARG